MVALAAGLVALAAGLVALAAGLVALAAGLVGVAAAVVTGFFVGVAALVPALADAVVVAGLAFALVFDDAAVLLAEPLVVAVLVAGFFVTCFFLTPLVVVVVVVVDEAEARSSLLEPSRNFLVEAVPGLALDACLAAAFLSLAGLLPRLIRLSPACLFWPGLITSFSAFLPRNSEAKTPPLSVSMSSWR